MLDEHFRVPYRDRFEEGEFRKRVQFMYGGKLERIRSSRLTPPRHDLRFLQPLIFDFHYLMPLDCLSNCKILLESRSMRKDEMLPVLDKLISRCVPEQNKKAVRELIHPECGIRRILCHKQFPDLRPARLENTSTLQDRAILHKDSHCPPDML